MLNTKIIMKLAVTTALCTCVLSDAYSQQAWTGGTTEYSDSGVAVDVSTPDANNTYLNQTGQLSVYRTPYSNVGGNETVTIGHDNTSSHFVMKADNGSNVTEIFGTVQTRLKDSAGNATASRGGNLTILDNNGVFFKPGSHIDSASLVASTGELNQDRLINDNVVELDNFEEDSKVQIESGANISVADTGLAAFVAPTVVNNGIITAKMGRVELAASGTKTTVDLYGDNLVEFAVDEESDVALAAQNNGEIDVSGGKGVIHMTTGATEDIVDSTVNMNGVAKASTATQEGGKIILGGNSTKNVNVAGDINAQNDEMEVSASDSVTFKNGSSVSKTTGTLKVASQDEVTVETGSSLNLGDSNVNVDTQTATLGDNINTTGGITGTASTVNVSSNQAEIQDGIDIAEDDASTEVNVAAGSYAGDITINKSLKLLGAQAGENGANRDGSNESNIIMNSPGVTIASDNTVVDGFTITGNSSGDPAILSDNVNNITVSNNIVSNSASGITVSGGDNITVSNNKISGVTDTNPDRISSDFQTGVAILSNNGASNVEITNNTITDGSDGVRVDLAGANNVVSGNDISGMRKEGIIVKSTTGAEVTGNTLTDNKKGVQVHGATDTLVDNNTINGTGLAGVIITSGSNGSVVTNNDIDGGLNGVIVNGGNDTLVSGNTITDITGSNPTRIDSDFQKGVAILSNNGASNVEITNNTITDGSDGVRVDLAGANNVVSGNDISGMRKEGIIVKSTTGAEVTGNTLTDNKKGVQVHGATETLVDNNTINGTGWRAVIVTSGSNGTSVTNNTINGGEEGININGGSNTVVAGNNIQSFGNFGIIINNGEVDISGLSNPNTISNGETGIAIEGSLASLTNDTLGSTLFSNILGNYIELSENALFNPGAPTSIEGRFANWDGVIVTTDAQRAAIENRIIDFDDNNTLGQIFLGEDESDGDAELDIAEEDIFALSLFDFAPEAGNVNVTFLGLPPTVQPDAAAFANIAPAAGGDSQNNAADDFANIEPASGGQNGCWASVNQNGVNGVVNYSFGTNIQSAITDTSCVDTQAGI